MKYIYIFGLAVFLVFCTNSYAQTLENVNLDSIKKELIYRINKLERISFKGEKYHSNCKKKAILDGLVTLKGNNEPNEWGVNYFVESSNNIDSIYFEGDTLLKIESRKPFKINENIGCKCGKAYNRWTVSPKKYSIKIGELNYAFNSENKLFAAEYAANSISGNDFFLYDQNIENIKNLSKTANTFVNSLVYNKHNEELIKFKQYYITANDTLKSEPISEAQRKLIVQANVSNSEKRYYDALQLYKKAININPYNNPDAYYNMALISAELKQYSSAILNMNKYLLLKPNADDARKAQDKIYEWELNIK